MRKITFSFYIILLIFSGCKREDEPAYADKPQIVVLMYHKISCGQASNLYERSKEEFEKDLKYLINNNISIISFSDLENIKKAGKMPARHSAIITFDDGDRSWYDIAVPLLKRYGMKATFFLWVEKIGSNSFLNRYEIQYISNISYQSGIKPFVFGSHSYSHPFLHSGKSNFATPEEYNLFLNWELSRSKECIEELTPGEVTILALPYGDGAGDPGIIAAAQQNRYKFIRTSRNDAIGDISGLDLFNIPSLPMLANTEQDEIGYYLNN
ncbi:MAG TPA: hypothetical protein DDW27_11160 [Bacteroidales bacterium]|nr:hypothetical protein [Bacteroidales bacterium]